MSLKNLKRFYIVIVCLSALFLGFIVLAGLIEGLTPTHLFLGIGMSFNLGSFGTQLLLERDKK